MTQQSGQWAADGGDGNMTGSRINRRAVFAAGVAAAGTLAVRDAFARPKAGQLILIQDQQPTYGSPPVAGGTLAMYRPTGSASNFNPAAFAMDFQIASSYLDPLLRPDDLTMAPTPWLAESWEVSDDGLQITYLLRDGVVWHNGSPFSSEDVAFSFEVYRDDQESNASNFLASFVAADTPDPRTVVVTLDVNDPTWLFNASTLPIFSVAQYGDYWYSQPVGFRTLAGFDWNAALPDGTGPWMIDGWNEVGVSLSANTRYWTDPPLMSNLEIRWESSLAAREQAWVERRCDIVWPIRAADIDRVSGRIGRLYAANAASVMFLAFNFDARYTANPGVFADIRTRQALSMAINREAIGQQVFGGFAQSFAAGTVSQPWAHDEKLKSPDYDPDEAVALLNEAGWVDYTGDGYLADANGQGLAMAILLDANAPAEIQRAVARVKLDWENIGVNVYIQIEKADEFTKRWTKLRNYDLIAFSFDQFPGFSDFDLYGSGWDIRRNLVGWNPGGYENPDADAAIEEYLAAVTIEDQRAALLTLQQAVDEDLAGIWLGFPQSLILVGADVLGFQPSMAWQTANTARLWRADESVS